MGNQLSEDLKSVSRFPCGVVLTEKPTASYSFGGVMKFRKFLKEHVGKNIEIDVLDNSSFPRTCKLISFDTLVITVDYGEKIGSSQTYYGIMYHSFGTIFWMRKGDE